MRDWLVPLLTMIRATWKDAMWWVIMWAPFMGNYNTPILSFRVPFLSLSHTTKGVDGNNKRGTFDVTTHQDRCFDLFNHWRWALCRAHWQNCSAWPCDMYDLSLRLFQSHSNGVTFQWFILVSVWLAFQAKTKDLKNRKLKKMECVTTLICNLFSLNTIFSAQRASS